MMTDAELEDEIIRINAAAGTVMDEFYSIMMDRLTPKHRAEMDACILEWKRLARAFEDGSYRVDPEGHNTETERQMEWETKLMAEIIAQYLSD